LAVNWQFSAELGAACLQATGGNQFLVSELLGVV